MSDNNVGDLSELIEPLKAKLAEATDAEERLRAEAAEAARQYKERIHEAVETRRRIEKTYNLLTLGRTTKEAGTGPKRKSGPRVNEETLEKVLAAMPRNGDDITVGELKRAGLSLHDTSIRSALETAREQELVRKAGKRKSAHDRRLTGATAQAYALMGNG